MMPRGESLTHKRVPEFHKAPSNGFSSSSLRMSTRPRRQRTEVTLISNLLAELHDDGFV